MADVSENTSTPDPAGLDLALLKQVCGRDREAFSALYCRFQPKLFGYLRRMLRDACTAEEVLDDVMLVVWKDASKFRGKSAVSTWVFGIAYRKGLAALGKEKRYQSRLDHSVDEASLVGHTTTPDNWLDVGLQHLSVDHRQIIDLTYFGGFSYDEIAAIVGCPVNTVKTRMFHARRRLQVLLPKLGEPRVKATQGQVK